MITNQLKCNNNLLHLRYTCVTLRFTTDMIKEVKVQQGRRWITVLELTLFAFTTSKGTFTLSGTNTDGTDTWKNINTGEFHEWSRKSVKSWWKQGKINPVEEATSITWNIKHPV